MPAPITTIVSPGWAATSRPLFTAQESGSARAAMWAGTEWEMRWQARAVTATWGARPPSMKTPWVVKCSQWLERPRWQ